MKEGYLYLVVTNRHEGRIYHYHCIGILVEGTGKDSSIDEGFLYRDSFGDAQWMLPEHVIEIGEI